MDTRSDDGAIAGNASGRVSVGGILGRSRASAASSCGSNITRIWSNGEGNSRTGIDRLRSIGNNGTSCSSQRSDSVDADGWRRRINRTGKQRTVAIARRNGVAMT